MSHIHCKKCGKEIEVSDNCFQVYTPQRTFAIKLRTCESCIFNAGIVAIEKENNNGK